MLNISIYFCLASLLYIVKRYTLAILNYIGAIALLITNTLIYNSNK